MGLLTEKDAAKSNKKPEVLPDLFKALYDTYQETRTGVHVSDIVLCPRKRVFREIDPRPVTNIELNFFTSGKAIHAALQDLAARHPQYELEQEIYLKDTRDRIMGLRQSDYQDGAVKEYFLYDHGITEDNSVSGHIDIYDKKNNIPIEAKSMRKASVDTPKPHHVRQLSVYMAITGARFGIVLYQLLLHFGKTPFREFVIEMTQEERQKMIDWLMIELQELRLALKAAKPALARHVMLDPDYNWQCTNCPYLKECQAINMTGKFLQASTTQNAKN